jgi:sphingomyelin phosphodiesterase acid-like 3
LLNHLRLRSLVFALLCLFLLAGLPRIARAQQKPVQALFVSDLHFEPFWDPGKVKQLDQTLPTGWPAILAPPNSSNRAAEYAALEADCYGRGQDTSFPLFQSSLDEMKKDAPGIAFITVSGDLLSHRIQCEYQQVFPPNNSKQYLDQYRGFIEKTITFLIAELNAIDSRAPVYVALGNNDSDCGDWQLSGPSQFLIDVGSEITKVVPAPERQQAIDSFKIGGYYNAPLPAPIDRARLLVLDDLFLGNGYSPCPAGSSAAGAELKWLRQQLDDAGKAGQKVWVIGHIPTGVDPYSTLASSRGQCQFPTMFMTPDPTTKSDPLADLLRDSSDIVKLGIFAHTHMDEIKLVAADTSGAPAAPLKAVPVKVVPSISPFNGNNPAFTVATVDPATATLLDYDVYSATNPFDITPSGRSGAKWAFEYAYNSYGENSFSADDVADLIAKFAKDSKGTGTISKAYIRHYISDKANPTKKTRFPGTAWPQYVCALSHNTASDFTKCACPSH